MALGAPGRGSVLASLHMLAVYAESRGWVFYRRRPPRVRMLGLLEELVQPSVEHLIEERSSEAIRAEQTQSGEGGEADPGFDYGASVTPMIPSDVEGATFGPSPWLVAADTVSDFVGVIGDDPDRWVEVAPPGFAAAALFVVAPELLDRVSSYSVIHGEQTFTWHTPMFVGGRFDTTGTVRRVRERGGVYFVSFDVRAEGQDGPVMEGTSLFLVSGETTHSAIDSSHAEPRHSDRGRPRQGELAASRADLVRYAAATRDWNPVHWDHEAAVAAGLRGIVAHGLMQAGWGLCAVARDVPGPRPLVSARLRFRNPLPPARPVGVEVSRDGPRRDITIADDSKTYMTGRVEISNE